MTRVNDRGPLGSLFNIRQDAKEGKILKAIAKVILCATGIIPLIAVIAWLITVLVHKIRSQPDSGLPGPSESTSQTYAKKIAYCDFNADECTLFEEELAKCDLSQPEGRNLLKQIVEETCKKIKQDTEVGLIGEAALARTQYSTIRNSLIEAFKSSLGPLNSTDKTKAAIKALQIIFRYQFQTRAFSSANAEATFKAIQSTGASLPPELQVAIMCSILQETKEDLSEMLKIAILANLRVWQRCLSLLKTVLEAAQNMKNGLDAADKENIEKINNEICEYQKIQKTFEARLNK